MYARSPALQRFTQSLLWAVAAWTIMQAPVVQQSWMGAPDKEGLETVFQLQQNQIGGQAAPLLFVDFATEDWKEAAARRPPPEPGAEPTAAGPTPLYLPRYALGQTLDFLRTTRANAVFVDVDTSAGPSAQDDRYFAEAIDRWRATPGAPLLILARTDWTTPSIFERTGIAPLRPSDHVVEAQVRISSSDNEVDSVEYWSCEGTGAARAPRANASVYLAAAARFGDGAKGKAAVQKGLDGIRCSGKPGDLVIATPGRPMEFGAHTGPIYYHLAMEDRPSPTGDGVLWSSGNWKTERLRPDLARRCGQDSAPVAMRVRVMDLLTAADAPNVSTEAYCGRTIVVGASANIARDVFPTVLGDLPGAFILGNAARGLDLVGPLRRFPYLIGLGYVLGITVAVFFAYRVTSELARRLLRQKTKGVGGKLFKFVVDNVTHPLSLSLLLGNVLSLVGLIITYFTIKAGLWGVFAASSLAASFSNAFDDVSDMRAALLARNETGERA